MADSITRSRWYLKKAARKGLALGAYALGELAVRRRLAAGPQVRVLTYHRFRDADYDPFSVSPRQFEAQMRYLAEHELAISLADLEAFLDGRKHLRDGAVLVTADDGLRSVYTEMLPILRRYAIPAVAYVTASLVCDRAAGDCPNFRPAKMGLSPSEYLSWDELAELSAGGVAVGSHGWTHRSLGQLPQSAAREEAARSQEVLAARLGRSVTSFAYPFGTRADFNDVTAGILAESGYTTALTSQHGAVGPHADALELPRIKIEGGEGLWLFRLACRGALDGWGLVDRALWRVQQAGRKPA